MNAATPSVQDDLSEPNAATHHRWTTWQLDHSIWGVDSELVNENTPMEYQREVDVDLVVDLALASIASPMPLVLRSLMEAIINDAHSIVKNKRLTNIPTPLPPPSFSITHALT